MKIKGNLFRLLFVLNLLLFVFSIFSPWVSRYRINRSMDSWDLASSGKEVYWSFQSVFYPFSHGYENRLVLWDFWFSFNMYYYGFTFEWIRIFVFQLLTVFSAIFAVVRGWQKTSFMLLPTSFSMLSTLTGLVVLSRFSFGRGDFFYPSPEIGLAFALFSACGFLLLFVARYYLERRKSKKRTENTETITPQLL